jgi:glycosyltransferase involved in cell wall biosynthesis
MRDSISPMISIVIPTYNRAELIGKAIQSVLDQTYKNWELIIVDNYSDDNTKEIIEAFNDDRILMLFTPRTGSVAASRNLGVAHSNGEWIAFLDSDDWWFPRKLEFVSEIIQQEPDLIYHDLQIVSLDGLPIKRSRTKSRRLKSPVYFDLLLNGNDIPLSSVVLRKLIFTFVNGMNESPNFFAIEDYDAWLRIAQVTEKFLYVPKIFGAYRLHEGNIGHLNNFQYLSSALKEHLNNLNSLQLRRYQSLYTYQIARNHYRNKNYRSSTVPLIFALRNAKFSFSVKALLMLIMNFIFRGIIPKK